MTSPFFSEESLDDLMRAVYEGIQSQGTHIEPTKGPATELTGVLLELTNPRARLSRTETRGKPFSCLGELCWYLASSNKLDFIEYYIRNYKESADGDEIFGGYGPRLFNWDGINQVENVIERLRDKPSSRKAVIQLFDRIDITEKRNDVACTCTMQFLIRDEKLIMITHMRSNDVFIGLPHDIFCFTMIQELVARSLSSQLGTYKHAVGSLHLYETFNKRAHEFLNEGWQSTENPMPPMPEGDPWKSIENLLKAEALLRSGEGFEKNQLIDIDPYWADLIRLLQVFRFKKEKDPSKIKTVSKDFSVPVYQPFIDNILSQLA